MYLYCCISDTPSAPRGPGSVQSKPETDSIELRWNTPESDGGAAITDYLVERREVTKKSWKQVRPNGVCACVEGKFRMLKFRKSAAYSFFFHFKHSYPSLNITNLLTQTLRHESK